MSLSFTKIIFAGIEHILITDDTNWYKPILILDSRNIDELNLEWNRK